MKLAEVWNGNDSGVLWTKEWLWDEDAGYRVITICSGVFTPPQSFDTEDEFWDFYEAEAAKWHGRKLNPTPKSQVQEAG